MPDFPSRTSYDVVIVGGGIMGAAVAWFLTEMPDFDGRILIVERDPTYATASTTHTNSCIRQQFSTPLNIAVSRFTAAFLRELNEREGEDPPAPRIDIRAFGYLYLAQTDVGVQVLHENHAVQRSQGVATELLTPDEILARYPFYNVSDIRLGSINTVDEGYFDGAGLFDWWRQSVKARGVEFTADKVVGLTRGASRITSVKLASGASVSVGQLVNAAGPRCAEVAAMAGISVPVEPRKRFTWLVKAAHPLDRDLPLTIDPSGIHFHERGGGTYMVGAAPMPDCAVDPADFDMDHDVWEARVWPVVAARIPAFEALRVVREWAGHYAMNTFDQNAILGPHPVIRNLVFINGFSGHGLQQAPAMGRAAAEWMVHGEYRTMDLSPFEFGRIEAGRPIREKAII